jgi:hypothetical protein
VRVFGFCRYSGCGKRFEMTAEQAYNVGTDSERRYCGPLCSKKALKERQRERPGQCPCCGPSVGVWVSYGGLTLCSWCRGVFGRSCWRKLRSEDAETALTLRGEGEYFPYRCPLCKGWHVSGRSTSTDLDYLERITRLARYFEVEGVDVAKLREGVRVR